MSVILKGTQMFAAYPSDFISQEVAKGWIEAHGLTSEDVRIVRNDSYLAVLAKKDLDF